MPVEGPVFMEQIDRGGWVVRVQKAHGGGGGGIKLPLEGWWGEWHFPQTKSTMSFLGAGSPTLHKQHR